MDTKEFYEASSWFINFLYRHPPNTPLPPECKEVLNEFIKEKKNRGEEISQWLDQLASSNGVKGE